MNVFLCCLQGDAGDAIKPYRFWRANLVPSLEGMGHRVLEPQNLDFVEPLLHAHDPLWLARSRAEASHALVEQVKKAHQRLGVDLFFSYFYSLHVLPDAIRDIRRMGIPTVNFFCDNLRIFQSVRELAPHFDLNWVPERRACPLYQAIGAPYVHLPMAASADYYGPPSARDGESELEQVTFVGSVDGLRTRLLAAALSRGVTLRVYGNGWKRSNGTRDGLGDRPAIWQRAIGRAKRSSRQHWYRLRYYGVVAEARHLAHRGLKLELLKEFEHLLHPSVSHDQMVWLANRSAVFLGINRCPHPGYAFDSPLVYSRLRDIEGPMMGACYLTEYCDDLEDLYEIGREVAVYHDGDELVEEAQRLLRDSHARRELRRRGRAAALGRHTWQHRFGRLFAALGFPTIGTNL